MNNSKITLFIFPVMILLSMWAITQTLTIHEFYRDKIIGIAAFLIFLTLIARRVSLDVKFLTILVLGYSLGGKGFAYLSPSPPFYIGEIALSVCFVYYFVKLISRRVKPGFTPLHISFYILFLYSVMHFLFDFEVYKLLAVRDFATVYYGLFFVIAYSLFDKEKIRSLFKKIFLWALYLGLFAKLAVMLKLHLFLYNNVHPIFGHLFVPHADILVPLNAAALVYFSISGIRKRNLFLILMAFLALILVLSGKTAGLVALVGTVFIMANFGKVRELWGILFGSLVFGVLAIGIFYVVEPQTVEDWYSQSDHLNTISISGGGNNNAATTAWRLNWWSTIATKTFAENPAFGLGFGADISTEFITNYLGLDASSEEAQLYARYPHSILFTMLGRLGLIGMGLFIIFAFFVLRTSIIYNKKIIGNNTLDNRDIIPFAIMFSGFVNSFIQATYETPYAAIVHWIALAYVAQRVYGKYNPKIKN